MSTAAAIQKGVQMASQKLDDEHIRQLADTIFAKFDKDGNGALSVSELQNAADAYVKQLPGMSAQTAPASIVQKVHTSMDLNKNGLLEKEEFFQFCKKLTDSVFKPMLQQASGVFAKAAATPPKK